MQHSLQKLPSLNQEVPASDIGRKIKGPALITHIFGATCWGLHRPRHSATFKMTAAIIRDALQDSGHYQDLGGCLCSFHYS